MSHVVTTPLGTITIPDSVLETVVRRAAESVDGAAVRRRGLSLEGRRVALALSVRYGVVLPELARDVQERVAAALRESCGVEVDVVDVVVQGLS